MNLLKVSLQKMLKSAAESNKKGVESEGNLMIMEILLKDHEKLRELILPDLAFEILTFLKLSKINAKRVIEFYLNVIEPSN